MRYNLYYTTEKGTQLVDYSNHKTDLEDYISNFSDNLDGTLDIVEKTTLIDIDLIKVRKSYKTPNPEKLNNYRKICDNCKGRLLEQNPIVIWESDNILVDGYCTLIILKEMGVKGNIPVSLYGRDNRIRLVYGTHKPQGKEYVWKIKAEKHRKIGGIKQGDKLTVWTCRGVQTITVTRTELVPFSFEISHYRNVKGKVNQKGEI